MSWSRDRLEILFLGLGLGLASRCLGLGLENSGLGLGLEGSGIGLSLGLERSGLGLGLDIDKYRQIKTSIRSWSCRFEDQDQDQAFMYTNTVQICLNLYHINIPLNVRTFNFKRQSKTEFTLR